MTDVQNPRFVNDSSTSVKAMALGSVQFVELLGNSRLPELSPSLAATYAATYPSQERPAGTKLRHHFCRYASILDILVNTH